MSSRALRRLQKEQEEERLRQQAEASSEEEEEESPIQPVKKSAFDMLNAMGAEDEDSDDADDAAPQSGPPGGDEDPGDENEDEDMPTEASKPTKKSKAKKKKKKKSKAKDSTKPQEAAQEDADLDEIDRALKSLGTTDRTKGGKTNLVIDRDLNTFYSLLAVDKQHLNALNEMRKLFGSVVLERDDEEDAAARRQRTDQGVAISDFLSARYSRVSKGQGLSGLALRQNAFMVGKPEWPKAASGGLSMELVERADDFTTEYRFMHNAAYQRVQRDFEMAVRTMDPQAMFQMVFNNPYHISSLLQTAEVLKHQGDHSVAADLYERALYNFGRSVQSTFSAAIAEGKARLDFRRPENREFWLTVYRYIGALIQKGTFRTAYEWAKLLLSLDPEGDPYCVRLIIDQLALRGGQAEHLIKLAATKTDVVDWGQSAPNVQISLCLAHYRTKNNDNAKEMLTTAVKNYPWIFTRLYQGLDIDQTPKTIWGALPRSDIEKYQTESYASRAKDVWNTPETSAFLNEVVKNVDKTTPGPLDKRSVSLDEARHAIVSEITSLIGAVPREYTTMPTTAADPLPPPDSTPSYNTSGDRELDSDEESELDQREINRAINQVRQNIAANGGQGTGVMGLLGRALNMFTGRGAAPQDSAAGPEESLGAQMGMEEVQVRTMQEYEEALNRGQWPVLDEAAAPEVLRELERQGVVQAGGNSSPGESEGQRLARREQEAEAVREAQNRRQATVEDDDDEDGPPSAEAQSQAVASQQSMGSMTRQEIVEQLSKDYDNDSNKRWLAGRGMLGLKDFVTTNGSDEKVWLADPRVDKAPLTEYLARVSLLKSAQDKNFILEYSLKQGAGAPASDLVRRLL